MEMNDSSLNFHCANLRRGTQRRMPVNDWRSPLRKSHIERQWITHKQAAPKDSLAATESASDVPRVDDTRIVKSGERLPYSKNAHLEFSIAK